MKPRQQKNSNAMPESQNSWYVRRRAVDEYKQTLVDEEPLPMLKTLKILRAIIVNIGIMALSGYFVYEGGDPTIIGVMSLGVLAAYNGLEISDYLALLQAVQEIKSAQDNDE